MRFKSLDELVAYMFENNVVIGDIEMDIDGATAEDPTVTPDVVAEPPVEEPIEDREKLQEAIVIKLASSDIHVVLENDGSILVDDFHMTPNACGAGTVVIQGRTIHLNMCEMDGKTMAYLHTDKGANQPVAVRRK